MQRQFPAVDVSVTEISSDDLKRRLDDGEEWTLLDTRRPDDFEQWTLSHPNLEVINVPFTEFLDETGQQPAKAVPDRVPAKRLVTCCAKGISSLYVAEFLADRGWDVLALEDGMEGWARLNETHPLETTGDVEVLQFHRPSSGCLAYLLVSGEEAAVIDPLRAFAREYDKVAREHGARLRYAIDTHVHADHVSGIREVAAHSDATPVLPAGAVERGLTFDATLVEGGERLTLGEREIEATALPGHTTEMLGYRFGDVFVTGDTLFLDSVARPDLEDEQRAKEAAATLWETLQRLSEVPGETTIAPAHVSPTTAPRADGTFTATLADLKRGLSAFGETQETFVERVVRDLPPRPNNFERIIAVNLGEETVTDGEAFELELGPNNCAVQ